MTRIFVVEDDRDIASLVSLYLTKSGWQPEIFDSGTEALAAIKQTPPDLVILDLMLPGMDGLAVCLALRSDSATARIPVIMVTARGDETDRIVGLELGADDYLPKPFSPNELVARVKALLRRAQPAALPDEMRRFRSITMDLTRHTVSDAGADIKLTAKEFLLLGERMPAQRAYSFGMVNKIVARDVLREEVAAIAAKLAAQPRLGAWLTKQAVNQVEELRGKSSAITSTYHMHHFAHAQNDLTMGSSIAGLDAKAMAAANKKQAGE